MMMMMGMMIAMIVMDYNDGDDYSDDKHVNTRLIIV